MTVRKKAIDVSTEPLLSEAEAAHIRIVIEPRLKSLRDGTAELLDFDQAFDEIEADVFGISPQQ